MKIAVVGAGIFGSTTAVILARNGYDVTLFEKEGDILKAASGINQYRLHRGYHYPRSKDTALSSKTAEESFLSEYKDCVNSLAKHYYAISKDRSLTSRDEFLKFCDECDLKYKINSLPLLNQESIQLVVEVEESLIDPFKLKKIVKKNISSSGVKLMLNSFFKFESSSEFDFVINATYAGINSITDESNNTYQFEVCEKPVLKLPDVFKNVSIVILDGPFTCIDPLGDTGNHVMGNVVHAVHSTNIGLFPIVPKELESLINKGIIPNPKVTNIDRFMETAKNFMPEIEGSQYLGSMYTIRTVLSGVDKTDERPTQVYWYNNKIINVFSGKIGNSVSAANEVLNLLRSV